MRRRLLSNKGLDEYLVFQTKSYDTTFDACLKNMPDGPGNTFYQYTHWDKIIPKTQTYTTIKIYSKNKKYKVRCITDEGGTVYIGTSSSSKSSTTFTSTSLGVTETTLYINHGVTPANFIGNRNIHIYVEEDGVAEYYGYRLRLMQERTLQRTFSVNVSSDMPYKATNPTNDTVKETGLSSGSYSLRQLNLKADKLNDIYTDKFILNTNFVLENPDPYSVYGYDNLFCRITFTSGGDWGLGAYIENYMSDWNDGVYWENSSYYQKVGILWGYTYGGASPGSYYAYIPFASTFDGTTGGGSVKFELYDSDYEIWPKEDPKTGRYIMPSEDKKILEVEVPYYYTVGTGGSTPPPPQGGLSFALQLMSLHDESNGLIYSIGEDNFTKIFSNYYGGTPYFMFGVWKKSATTYTPTTALWRMYLGSNEYNSRKVGFFGKTYNESYTDISRYGIELLSGCKVDFEDDSERDYGNIKWIRVAEYGTLMGTFQFKLTRETIDNITSGLSDNTELVVGIHSQKTLSQFRGSKYDGLDGLPANGYRSNPDIPDSPWVWTSVSEGQYVDSGTNYYITTVGAIKTGGSGFNTLFMLS